MQVRPFRFPADLETMLAIAAASFQYDDHPEWSLPSDLALIMRRQLQAIRFTLPLLQALSVFDARQAQSQPSCRSDRFVFPPI